MQDNPPTTLKTALSQIDQAKNEELSRVAAEIVARADAEFARYKARVINYPSRKREAFVMLLPA